MRHYTIPIFVPHLGCPCQCSFCNQKTITGASVMTPDIARQQILQHLETIPESADTEIAFFGGSFTAIPPNEMEALLEAASPFLASGRVSSIRISTRPDAIDRARLNILADYGVRTIELGIQSMSDTVLNACRRGHTADDSRRAAELIIAHGFTLGGQMMVGLPSASPADEIRTAEEIVKMGAREARIYPVVVFAHTPLADEAARGLYVPLSVHEAIERSIAPLEILQNAKIKLLRIGLCESESLHAPEQVISGAYHPALGELCYSALYRKRISKLLTSISPPPNVNLKISVAPGKLSMAIGQKRCNYTAIMNEFLPNSLKFVEDPTLSDQELRVDLLQQ